ncbi:hypothetical protein AHF37_01337 [Paragonimus kellicotti]|nr:hypothetical protein AHF37_01337 [Paragonimus kellicotti]
MAMNHDCHNVSPLPVEVKKLQQMNDKLFAQIHHTSDVRRSDNLSDLELQNCRLKGAITSKISPDSGGKSQHLTSLRMEEDMDGLAHQGDIRSISTKSSERGTPTDRHLNSPTFGNPLDYSTHSRLSDTAARPVTRVSPAMKSGSSCASYIGSFSSSSSPSPSLPDNCSGPFHHHGDSLTWKPQQTCGSPLNAIKKMANQPAEAVSTPIPVPFSNKAPIKRRGRLKKDITDQLNTETQTGINGDTHELNGKNFGTRKPTDSLKVSLKRHNTSGLSAAGNGRTNVTTAAYKYLTWREKDRRRRFREEWKHLWLVIPHGRYEVMCLVCHKVMTQRKLDTIKRHTNLFEQLVRQHSALGALDPAQSTNSVPMRGGRKTANEFGRLKAVKPSGCGDGGPDRTQLSNLPQAPSVELPLWHSGALDSVSALQNLPAKCLAEVPQFSPTRPKKDETTSLNQPVSEQTMSNLKHPLFTSMASSLMSGKPSSTHRSVSAEYSSQPKKSTKDSVMDFTSNAGFRTSSKSSCCRDTIKLGGKRSTTPSSHTPSPKYLKTKGDPSNFLRFVDTNPMSTGLQPTELNSENYIQLKTPGTLQENPTALVMAAAATAQSLLRIPPTWWPPNMTSNYPHPVMCLVCHKVMTQRKLDTIKRHTVRRHVELLGMPETERQNLFEQLVRQHSALGALDPAQSTNSVPMRGGRKTANEFGRLKAVKPSGCGDGGPDRTQLSNLPQAPSVELPLWHSGALDSVSALQNLPAKCLAEVPQFSPTRPKKDETTSLNQPISEQTMSNLKHPLFTSMASSLMSGKPSSTHRSVSAEYSSQPKKSTKDSVMDFTSNAVRTNPPISVNYNNFVPTNHSGEATFQDSPFPYPPTFQPFVRSINKFATLTDKIATHSPRENPVTSTFTHILEQLAGSKTRMFGGELDTSSGLIGTNTDARCTQHGQYSVLDTATSKSQVSFQGFRTSSKSSCCRDTIKLGGKRSTTPSSHTPSPKYLKTKGDPSNFLRFVDTNPMSTGLQPTELNSENYIQLKTPGTLQENPTALVMAAAATAQSLLRIPPTWWPPNMTSNYPHPVSETAQLQVLHLKEIIIGCKKAL